MSHPKYFSCLYSLILTVKKKIFKQKCEKKTCTLKATNDTQAQICKYYSINFKKFGIFFLK